MEQTTVLVTSDGKHVLPPEDEFFAALRNLAPGCDAAQFAVRNLGFVKLAALDAATTVIELNPHSVDPRALLAAELQIGMAGAAHFRIRYVEDDRPGEPPLSPTEAVGRLRALQAATEGPATTERFRAEPLDYGTLMRISANPLCLLSQKWCASFGEFSPSVTEFAAESGFIDKMALVGVSRRRPEPVFRFIGAGFPWLRGDFPQRAIGEKLESLPDKEYGAWVAGFYIAVAQRGEPRYDRVTAHLVLDDGRVHDAYYERLLLPWRAPSGETIVSLLSSSLPARG